MNAALPMALSLGILATLLLTAASLFFLGVDLDQLRAPKKRAPTERIYPE